MHKKKIFPLLDIFKFVLSLLILGIHIQLLTNKNSFLPYQLFQTLGRIGVPFFFISSAFLFFRTYLPENQFNRKKRLEKYCKRILILYLSWCLIYLPINIIRIFLISHNTFATSFLIFIRNILTGTFFITSWYLGASILGVCIICYLSEKMPPKILLMLTLPIYLLIAYFSIYYKILPIESLNYFGKIYSDIFSFFPTSIFSGIFYIAVGYYLAFKFVNQLRAFKPNTLFSFAVVSFALLFIEYNFFRINWPSEKFIDAGFFTILPAISLVLISIRYTNISIQKEKLAFCRNSSILIFLIQSYFIYSFNIIRNIFSIDLNLVLVYILALIISLFTTYLISVYKKKYQFLNNLY